MISLEQMFKVPQLYQEVAHAARTRAAGTASAAEEADSIRRLSEWQGASGEAADDANRRQQTHCIDIRALRRQRSGVRRASRERFSERH